MRAIEIGTLTCGSVRSILDNKHDRRARQPPPGSGVLLLHPNIRTFQYPDLATTTEEMTLC